MESVFFAPPVPTSAPTSAHARSAVDQHTAIHIFNHCIRGMLRNKAVVWITHQLELLPQCDKIAIMEGGEMTYFGPYSPDVLNQRLPVDHLLFATVEAGDAAVKASTPGTPSGDDSNHNSNQAAAAGSKHAHHGAPAAPSSGAAAAGALAKTSKDLQKTYQKATNRKSFQRSSAPGIRAVDTVVGALTELAKQVRVLVRQSVVCWAAGPLRCEDKHWPPGVRRRRKKGGQLAEHVLCCCMGACMGAGRWSVCMWLRAGVGLHNAHGGRELHSDPQCRHAAPPLALTHTLHLRAPPRDASPVRNGNLWQHERRGWLGSGRGALGGGGRAAGVAGPRCVGSGAW